MADLFDKIFQNFKTYFNNGYNLLKKLRDIYYGGPQDVTLQWQDPDSGAIQNLTVPSFAKMRDRFISDVNSVMYKKIFVDAQDGSDTSGDGSYSAPFKTIDKALKSVIPGSAVEIILKPGVYTLIDDYYLCNNMIYLESYSSDQVDQVIVTHDIASQNFLGGFRLSNSTITVRYLTIKTYNGDPNRLNSETVQYGYVRSIFGRANDGGFGYINFYSTKIELNYGYLVNLSFGGDFYIVNLYTTQVKVNDTNSKLVYTERTHYPYVFSIHASTIKDSSGNNLQWKDYLDGIIRDSNGVPRNVISNIVL